MVNFRKQTFGIHLRHPYNKAGDGPEGPELRITTEWLQAHFANTLILNIVYNQHSSLGKNGTSNGLLDHYPLKVISITCKGKHMIWTCQTRDNNVIYFHNHLGMSGRWCLTEGSHSNMHLVIQDKGNLYFDDVRRFADFSIIYSLSALESKLKDVGTDLMDLAINYYNGQIEPLKAAQLKWLNLFQKIKNNYRSKNKCIYVLLMEQKHFSGLGNYLTAEVLYNCQVSPERKVSEIPPDKVIQLFNKAIEIIYLSYRYGGLTVKDFWDPEGRVGRYPRKVYGKSVDPNGNKVIKTKFSNGRTCHWVPDIQK